MGDKEIEIRNPNRVIKEEEEEEDDYEDFFNDLQNKDIITVENDQVIIEMLDQLFSDDADVIFSSLVSLAKLSRSFPKNFLESITPSHFEILWNLLEDDEKSQLVIFIFSKLSKKGNFTPPTTIFTTISNILSNKSSDDTEIENTLKLTKNLINTDRSYYLRALQDNILQIIIDNDNSALKIIKLKLSTLSTFLKYENSDIEDEILPYLMKDEFIQSDERLIYRCIISGFEYAMDWSDNAVQIINGSNLVSISIDLLLSDNIKDVNSALSFLKKCIKDLNIVDIQFAEFFALLMIKEKEDNFFKEIINLFIILISTRSTSVHFLFDSLSEYGINELLDLKSYPIKKLFLSFLNESARISPKEFIAVQQDDLCIFIQEMIQTGESDTQFLSLEIICTLIFSMAEDGDICGKWINSFSQFLISLNILDDIYQSSIIDECPNAYSYFDSLSSFLKVNNENE